MEGTHERAETVFGFPVCSQRGGGQEGNGREWGRGEGEGGGEGKGVYLVRGRGATGSVVVGKTKAVAVCQLVVTSRELTRGRGGRPASERRVALELIDRQHHTSCMTTSHRVLPWPTRYHQQYHHSSSRPTPSSGATPLLFVSLVFQDLTLPDLWQLIFLIHNSTTRLLSAHPPQGSRRFGGGSEGPWVS